MSRFFRFNKRGLLIDIHNPVSDIALPKPYKSSDKVIGAGELRQLLNKLSSTMALIVELEYETAIKRSEILKLTTQCLHLDERIADVVDGQNLSVQLSHLPHSSIKGDGVRVFFSGRDHSYRQDFHAPTRLLPQIVQSPVTGSVRPVGRPRKLEVERETAIAKRIHEEYATNIRRMKLVDTKTR